MLSTFIYAFSLILIVCGLFYLFSLLICYMLCGKSKDGICTVIFHEGTNEELYDKVYTAFLQNDFFTPFTKRPIIVIDNNVPEIVKMQCRMITEPWSNIHFVKPEDINSDFLFKG